MKQKKEKKYPRYRSVGISASTGFLMFDVYDMVTNKTKLMTNKDFQLIENEMLTEEEYYYYLNEHPIDPAEIFRECDGV